MMTRLSHILVAVACFAAGFAARFLMEHGGPREDASAPRRAELSIEDGGVYPVARVVDGDTLVLENGVHVRYQGVNTPEAGRFVSDPAPFSAQSTARNRQLVEGRRVRLTLGPEPVDAYGRVVARVAVLDEASPGAEALQVDEVLLGEGLGRVFGKGLTPELAERLKAAEARAKESKMGLWGATKPAAEGASAHPFCAASSSKVYHRAECSHAGRIVPSRYQGYANKAAAEATGRQPCSQCMKE